MKKLMLLAVTVISITACSKNNPVQQNNDITFELSAKWYYATDTIQTYLSGVLQKSTGTDYNHTYYIQFNTNGTGVKSDSVNTNFVYSISENTIAIRYASTGEKGLTNTVVNAEIKQLTSSNLTLFYPSLIIVGNTNGAETATETTHLLQ